MLRMVSTTAGWISLENHSRGGTLAGAIGSCVGPEVVSKVPELSSLTRRCCKPKLERSAPNALEGEPQARKAQSAAPWRGALRLCVSGIRLRQGARDGESELGTYPIT